MLYLEQNNPTSVYSLGVQLESSFPKNDLQLLVGKKLNMAQLYTFAEIKANYWVALARSTASRFKGIVISLYSAHVKLHYSKVLCPGLGSPVLERYLQARASPVEDHQDGFGPESGKVGEKIENLGNNVVEKIIRNNIVETMEHPVGGKDDFILEKNWFNLLTYAQSQWSCQASLQLHVRQVMPATKCPSAFLGS